MLLQRREAFTLHAGRSDTYVRVRMDCYYEYSQ